MVSSSLIGWLISLVFIIILVAGFFVGFWRGLKRSTFNLIISIVGVLVAFFITPSITSSVLGIKITVNDTQTTLENTIVEALKSDKDISNLMQANKNLEVFFMNLPRALFNTLIFIVVTIAIELVLYIIYKVIAATLLKVKKDEKKHGLAGGIVGLVKTLIVMLLAFMPLAGLTGVANNLMTTENYGIVYTIDSTEVESKSILEDKLPEGATNVIVGLENNMLIKMCGIFGLDNAMFDYYSSFKIDDEKLYVRKEVEHVYEIVDFSYQISKADLSKVNFIKLRYDKVAKAVENTTNSTLFKKVVAETLADILIDYENYSFIVDSSIAKDYKDVLDNIKVHLEKYEEGEVYKYFQNDLVEAINAVKVLGQSGILNEVLDLESQKIEDVAASLTTEENLIALENSISHILNVNIVRDGIVTIIQKGLDEVSSELDKVETTTESWTEKDWEDLKKSVVNIVDTFGDISNEIDVMEVLKDATMLLDDTANYDISLITSKLGVMVDETRNSKLLKTSENKSIIDKLLETNNIKLPANEVVDVNGNKVTLTNYQQYFDFITPSLLKLRDEKVYKVVDDETLSSKQMLTRLAEIISEDGNKKLLNQIILPLYQVEPTKTLIIDKLTSSLQSDLINLSTLGSYDEWDKDLSYLSDMLITLNSLTSGDNTYLSIALDGDMDSLVDSLNEGNVDSVLKPILYAKSTSALRDKLFTSIKNKFDDASGLECTLDATAVTLEAGASENQADEICAVVKKLIAVNKEFDSGKTIKTMDKIVLGDLLNTMKTNAYRKELSAKEETGIFNSAFVNLMSKLKTEYSAEVEYIESDPEKIRAELGVSSLAEENYYLINYSTLLAKLAEAESAI